MAKISTLFGFVALCLVILSVSAEKDPKCDYNGFEPVSWCYVLVGTRYWIPFVAKWHYNKDPGCVWHSELKCVPKEFL